MSKKEFSKNRKIFVILIVLFVTGLSLLLYPAVSDYLNSLHQSRAVAAYVKEIEGLDAEAYDSLREEARRYNASLTESRSRFQPGKEETEMYGKLLDVSDNGVISYIEIPAIDVVLPIYKGTDEEVLKAAIGHIEGSSLPVGGESSHCVISGHRGLPSSRLFTDLDQLTEGDIFKLHTLEETLVYKVDRIKVVEPDDISLLEIEEGEDLCTLVTCTPYGVNSHRLLVRGSRAENKDVTDTSRVTADAAQIDPEIIAASAVILILGLFIICTFIKNTSKRK